MFFGRKEEGELTLSLHSVFLHRRIEIERRVVETACPWGVDAHLITFVVGKHRAGQKDAFLSLPI